MMAFKPFFNSIRLPIQLLLTDARRLTPMCKYSKYNNNDDSSRSDEIPKGFDRFKVFKDEDAPIILDIEEERLAAECVDRTLEKHTTEYFGLNLSRGVTGVYDLDDLVSLVKKERTGSLCVVSVPKELNYVDYLIFGTCTSKRHIMAVAQFIIKIYKKKRSPTDLIPRIFTENSDWVALDLGNIAVHLMTEEVRTKYNLESLWSVGSKFEKRELDDQDSLARILKKHDISLGSYTPQQASSPSSSKTFKLN